jgi:hypothetical protein
MEVLLKSNGLTVQATPMVKLDISETRIIGCKLLKPQSNINSANNMP